MIEAAVQHVLSAAAGVTALVGSRTFWGDRPQGNEVPALVHRCSLGDPVTASGSLYQTTVAVVGYAETGPAAEAIADAAVVALLAQSLNVNIGSTGHQFVGWSRPSIELAEPVPGDAESRADAECQQLLTLLYR